MIRAELVKGKEIAKKFQAIKPKVDSAIHQTVRRLALKLTGRVKQKLSGEVLHVRTGRLRRSIHPELEYGPGRAVATVGTNVIYARTHEYGATITPKKAKALRFRIGEKWVTTKKVVIPERSFLRSALREMAPDIKSELAKAVRKELGTL